MADMIQFNCPSCGTLLRLPTSAAGARGPCPNCRQEITAPGPDQRPAAGQKGSPADLTEKPIRLEPVQKVPHVVPAPKQAIGRPMEAAMNPAPGSPVAETRVAPRMAPRWIVLVLCCLFTGLVGVGLGFTFGVYSNELFNASAASGRLVVVSSRSNDAGTARDPITVEPVAEPPPSGPLTAKASEPDADQATDSNPEPVPAEAKTGKPAAPALKASAAAEASLRAFLEAADWAARSAHVLDPGKTSSAMEAYSHEVPDGPTKFKSISVRQSQIDGTTGNTLFIFSVMTEQHPQGIPVAVKETAFGWLVDWPTFVEFRDGLFQRFVDGPANEPRFFHLIVTRPGDNANRSTSTKFTCYDLLSPLADKSQPAFVKNDSHAAATLADRVSNGRIHTPVLEVVKRLTPDKRDYLEILSVKADDWFPRED